METDLVRRLKVDTLSESSTVVNAGQNRGQRLAGHTSKTSISPPSGHLSETSHIAGLQTGRQKVSSYTADEKWRRESIGERRRKGAGKAQEEVQKGGSGLGRIMAGV